MKLLERIMKNILHSSPPQVDPAQKAISNNTLPIVHKKRKVGIKPSALYYLKCLYCNRIRPIKEFNTKKTHTRCIECYNHYMKMVMRERTAAKKLINLQTDETMHRM